VAPLAAAGAADIASLVTAPAPVPSAPRQDLAKPSPAPVIVVQLGAYSTEARANEAWQEYRTNHPAIVGSLQGGIQVSNIPGRGMLYRLRVGPFADRAAAAAVCNALKAEGGACLVAVL
jgi:cell division septation protein DedD